MSDRRRRAGLPPAQDVVEAALAAAGPGSDHCVVIVEETSEVEVRFANNTTTTNGSRRDRRVTVISMRQVEGGMAAGVARRGGDVDVGRAGAARPSRTPSGSPPADDAFPLLDAGRGRPASDVRGAVRPAAGPPPTCRCSSGVLTDLAAAFGRARGSDHVLAGFAEHRQTTEYLGTTTGLRLAHAQPQGALHLVARSADGASSTWAGAGTTDFTDVSVEELEARLAERLAWSARRLERPAGRYEVLLPPEAVSDLMVGLAYELSGRNAEDGRTVFSLPGGGTRVGQQPGLDPLRPAQRSRTSPASSARRSSPPRRPRPTRRSSTTACPWPPPTGSPVGASSGCATTGPGRPARGWTPAGSIGNLDPRGAAVPPASLDELVARTERGLLLTCLWYIREVDPATMLLTGLTRDGVYVVEDGEVVGAANNFRFNESPVDLLGRVSEVGASVRALGREFGEYFNRTCMPAMRVPDFNMSSVSQAS